MATDRTPSDAAHGSGPRGEPARPGPGRGVPDASRRGAPPHLQVLLTLAALVERMDRAGTAPDPAQYRVVVQRLATELMRHDADPLLPQVLHASPAAAAVYENARYAHAGLCLQDVDRAAASEMAAMRALEQARDASRRAP